MGDIQPISLEELKNKQPIGELSLVGVYSPPGKVYPCSITVNEALYADLGPVFIVDGRTFIPGSPNNIQSTVSCGYRSNKSGISRDAMIRRVLDLHVGMLADSDLSKKRPD